MDKTLPSIEPQEEMQVQVCPRVCLRPGALQARRARLTRTASRKKRESQVLAAIWQNLKGSMWIQCDMHWNTRSRDGTRAKTHARALQHTKH